MDEAFEILAAKILAREASEAERLRFEEMLACDAPLRREFAELEATWNLLRENEPLIGALDAPPSPVPEERLRQLQAVVRGKFPAPASAPSHAIESGESVFVLLWRGLRARAAMSPALVALLLAAVLTAGVCVLNRPAPGTDAQVAEAAPVAYLLSEPGRVEVRRNGALLPVQPILTLRAADEVQLPDGTAASVITSNGVISLRGSRRWTAGNLPAPDSTLQPITNQTLRVALFSRVPQLLAVIAPVGMRSAPGIPHYSPNSATAYATPLIHWKAEPGKTYDLLITDEFDAKTPPWRLEGIVPPIDFSKVESWKNRPLAPGELYRLRLGETGRPITASEHTFRTLNAVGERPSGGAAAGGLLNAVKILASDSARTGDALAELLVLPAELADTEAVLRLKALLFAHAGCQDDYEAVTTRLAVRKQP